MEINIKQIIIFFAVIFLALTAYGMVKEYRHQQRIKEETARWQEIIRQTVEQSTKQAEEIREEQKRDIQALVKKSARQKKEQEQKALEANLVCESEEDTGKCSCYDGRNRQPINMSPELCMSIVSKQSP